MVQLPEEEAYLVQLRLVAGESVYNCGSNWVKSWKGEKIIKIVYNFVTHEKVGQ